LRAGLKKVILASLIIVILVLSLKLTASRSKWGPVKAADSAITTVYSYAARAVVYPIDAIKRFLRRIGELWQAAERTQKLNELEAKTEGLKIELEQLKRENERLSKLLNLAQRTESKTLAARVIDRTTNPRRTIIVDQGKGSGVKEGQAAVNASGLVGYVSDVGIGWSKITLITDPLCAVDAFVARSLEQGIVRGYKRGLLLMHYLPETADIEQGDLILTSGEGFIFPKGVPVGRVLSLERDPRTPGISAVLEPQAPTNRLFEVLIILREEGP